MERKKILKKINNSTGRDKFEALLEYSHYLRQKEPDESIRAAKQAMKIAKELQSDDLYLGALMYISYAYLYKDDYKEAHEQARIFLKEAQKLDSIMSIGSAFDLTGAIYSKQGKLNEAVNSYLKSLDCFIKADSKENLLSVYNNLGRVHLQKMEFDAAANYLKLALGYAKDLNHPASYPIKMNLANVIYGQKKYEEALKIYKTSAEHFHETEQLYYEANALYNIGLCYYSLEDYPASYSYYKKVYSIYKKMNIPENLADTSVTISELLLFMGKTHESLTYLEEAEKVAMANDLVDMQLKVFNVYSQYYQKIKDYPKAIEYLNKYIKKNKENQLRINEEKIAVLEAKYKTEIYKYKNKDLSKKNKAMQKQIRDLSGSLNELQQTHEKLKTEFQENAEKINKQDSLISSQARMAVMGEMISAIAHQWKQPLNVIWLLAQAIGDAWDYKEIDDEFMENQLSLIEDQVKYMNNTITDFRNFFKQDYYTEFNIADTVKKAVTLVRYILDKENIAIIEDIDNSCTISGNPNELNQVIINIINNAKDAILSSNTKNPEIKISLNCSDDDIQLKIYNNGEKIKQDHLSKIFEPYFTTKEKTGTGIGLHICKKIIEHKFKGNISVRNTETGVEFKITMKNK